MMKCEQARELLPLARTGDLLPAEAARVAAHVANCPSCRQEQAALAAVGRALDAAPAPAVNVDIARIYQVFAERQRRSIQRWRRLAASGLALAACLLVFLLSRLDFELGNGQLAIRWGPRPEPAAMTVAAEPVPPALAASAAPAELQERVEVLGELVRLLSEDLATRDRKRQEDIAVLRGRMDALLALQQRRWEENRRDVTALYTAQFGNRE